MEEIEQMNDWILDPFAIAHSFRQLVISWNGGTPKSSIFMGFFIINQPLGVPPFMETSNWIDGDLRRQTFVDLSIRCVIFNGRYSKRPLVGSTVSQPINIPIKQYTMNITVVSMFGISIYRCKTTMDMPCLLVCSMFVLSEYKYYMYSLYIH